MDIQYAYQLITEKLNDWVSGFIKLLPNIAVATIVWVLGLFVAKRLKNVAARLIKKVSSNHTINGIVASVVHVFLVGITLFTVLSILQLDKAVVSLLAGAGIVGLALAFAFQDIYANFICGIYIIIRKPIHLGDVVKVQHYMGTVEEVNLRDTVVRTFQGQMVIIPNKEVFQNPIENYSMLGKRRIDMWVGVSYGDDLDKVQRVTLEAVRHIKGLSPTDETTLFYQAFGDSSINFTLRMWVNSPTQPEYNRVGSEAIMNIKKAYDANNITIPFPIRTLDFGIKGGATLSQMKLQVAQ